MSKPTSKMKRGFKETHEDLNIAFIVFLILKGSSLVNWSWWVILSPYLARIVFSAIEGLIESILEAKCKIKKR